jgi:O-antigen/teichoic acid export membrane protein
MADDANAQLSYTKAAVLIATIAALTALAIAFSEYTSLTQWLFGLEVVPKGLFLLTAIYSISLVFHNLAVSLLSALGYFGWLNIVSLLNSVIWLLLAILWNTNPEAIIDILRWQAAATITLSLLVLIVCALRLASTSKSCSSPFPLWQAIKAYTSYGLPRVLSPFLDALLVAAGPWLLRHDLQHAAYLSMALMLLRIGQTLVTPAATVIGTAVARLHGESDHEKVSNTLRLTTGAFIALSTLAFAVMAPWSDLLVNLWLGISPLSAGVSSYARWLMFAIIPFIIFQGLKEPVEMLSVKPLILLATAVGLAVLCVVSISLRSLCGMQCAILVGYIVAYTVLGTATLLFIRKHLPSHRYFGLTQIICAAFSVAIINAIVAHLTTDLPLYWRCAAASACSGLTLLAAGWGLLILQPSEFLSDVSKAMGRTG